MLEFLQSLFQNDTGAVADFWLFLGRFHPMILHFPIGLLSLAASLEIYSLIKKKDYNEMIKLIWLWGTITSGIAVVLGFLLSLSGDYNEELLNWHFYAGTLSFIFASITCFLRQQQGLNFSCKFLTILTVIVMLFAGHDGASLTHGKEYIWKYAPNFIRELSGREAKKDKSTESEASTSNIIIHDTYLKIGDTDIVGTSPKEAKLISYKKTIEPIFADKCYSCHGEEKQKGDLRMDVIPFETESDTIIIPGNPDDSDLIYFISTDDMEDIMPPEGKDELKKEEIELIRQWVQQGAKFDN